MGFASFTSLSPKRTRRPRSSQAGEVVTGLTHRIRHSNGGSFLVTGFRGAGKTTAVLRTLAELEAIEPRTNTYLPTDIFAL